MSLQAYCHHCKLPTFEGHPKPDDCIAALRTALESPVTWQDNQRLQKELHIAKEEAREMRALLMMTELTKESH